MKILAIKASEGYYLTDNIDNKSYHNTNLIHRLINGEKVEKTWHKDWVLSKEEPKVMTVLTSQPRINHRYELKDPVTFPNLKPVYSQDEVFLRWDDDDAVFTDEFSGIYSLYELKSDAVPAKHVEVEFEMEVIAEVETINSPGRFSFEALNDRRVVTIDSPNYYAIHQILTPPIAIHDSPCFLTSKESYDIVRQYIKNNINPKVAVITSDYNFCFAVSKLVSITPYIHKTEIKKQNGRSYAKPRFNEKLVKSESHKFFEMTHNEAERGGRGRDGYTVLNGFKGENREDLKQTIDAYLGHLISAINTPLSRCSRCEGTGIEPENKSL